MGKAIKIVANVVGIALGVLFTFSLATSIGKDAPTFGLFLLTVPIIWSFYFFPQWTVKSEGGKIFGLLWGLITAFIGKYFVLILLMMGKGVMWFLS